MFAGDFWHVRGMLPVNPLNRVLEEFRDWKQPTLMLVGNHDQVPLHLLVLAVLSLLVICAFNTFALPFPLQS